MVIQHKTIINKEIIYSDTIIPLKELGENLKITTLKNIAESELEECLKLIIEANPQVTFNIIQYSKNDKKVYFYTDKTVQTKDWDNRKTKQYQPLDTVSNILNELKHITTSSDSRIISAISLDEVIKLLRKTSMLYHETKNAYDKIMKQKIANKFWGSSIINYGFQHDEDVLQIGFSYLRNGTYEKIDFSKHDGDLYIKSSSSLHDKQILALLGDELSELYDKLKALTDFNKQYKYRVQPINSSFLVNISSNSIRVYAVDPTNRYKEQFAIYYMPSLDKYGCEGNSYTLINAVKDNEDKILRNIFVGIDSCPEWMRPTLTDIRNKQLHLESKSNISRNEDKQVKKRTLIRKITAIFKK